jgi:hypothetical protein
VGRQAYTDAVMVKRRTVYEEVDDISEDFDLELPHMSLQMLCD